MLLNPWGPCDSSLGAALSRAGARNPSPPNGFEASVSKPVRDYGPRILLLLSLSTDVLTSLDLIKILNGSITEIASALHSLRLMNILESGGQGELEFFRLTPTGQRAHALYKELSAGYLAGG